jgi:tRNA A37 threonylcarbamoyladenosine dehydratase
MLTSSNTLKSLILERIKRIQPTVDLSVFDDYSDRDLLDDFEEMLTEYIIAEHQLNAD